MGEESLPFSRWWLVVAAAGAMGMAGTYQFVWSSIRIPLGAEIGVSETGLGTVFTLFFVFQTLAQFPAGWVRDRRGPRLPMLVGAIALAAGYVGAALAPTLPALYLAYSVGGAGAGITYTVAVNTSVKWFTERRGLATGVVTMAYSGVSFLLIPVVRGSGDIRTTLLGLGLLAGLVAVPAVIVLRDPELAGDRGEGEDGEEARGGGSSAGTVEGTGAAEAYTWRETVRTWQFWLMYAVFVAVNGVGLMLIGKVVAFAEVLSLPAVAATASASLVAVGDAGGLIVVSGLADRLGYERSLAVSLVLCGLALAGGVLAGGAGLAGAFVVLVTAAAFFRSPAFGILPSVVGSYYGEARSSENYAALYTAKLWGGVIGGAVASALVVTLGWTPSFLLGAVVITAAGAATFLLRPISA